MYKRIFITIIALGLLFPAVNSLAKPPKRKSGITWYDKTSFGFQGGVSFSRINIISKKYEEASFEKRSSTHTGDIVGVTGGVTGEYMFLKQFGVAVELLYARTGMYALPVSKVKQESIAAPISVMYYTAKKESGLRLHVGLQPSFALATTYYKLTGGKGEEFSEEEYEEDGVPQKYKLKSFDLVVMGGLAYRFANGVEIGLRITQGLLEHRDLEAKHNSDDAERETWLSIGNQLYVRYNLSKLFK